MTTLSTAELLEAALARPARRPARSSGLLVRLGPALGTGLAALSAAVRPYMNVTTVGLGLFAAAGFAVALPLGLAVAGLACLLAEFNAGR